MNSDFKEYIIAKIGELVDTEIGQEPVNVFTYNKRKYKLLLPEINTRYLLQDIKFVPNFSIHENGDHLYLTLRIWSTANDDERHTRYYRSAQRIIFAFFRVPGQHEENQAIVQLEDNEEPNGASEPMEEPAVGAEQTEETAENDPVFAAISIDALYARLREGHTTHDDFVRVDSVQHVSMLPILTAYQQEAVQWMLHRENGFDRFPTEFVEIESRWPSIDAEKTVFYYHPRKIEISDELNPFICIPTGGILAEEMGLGKTVETLSLILLNSRKSKEIEVEDVADAAMKEDDEDDEPLIKRKKYSHTEFKCICVRAATRDTSKLIACTRCHRAQHRKCVLKNSVVHADDKYICPECWQFEPPVRSAATFIVSPASIKMQWFSEIERHIDKDGFNVLIYEGIHKSGWISPCDLATYDVVLTDYNIMASEIHFTKQNKTDRQMRNPSRFITLPSPLLLVEWWRVCLDEAQMVESANNQAARMVKMLPATHRWAVTGTPLEKSIHDLYGLLFFMGCEPYDDHQVWAKISQQFVEGNDQPIIDVLRKIMWRTCKTPAILDQIKIPPQTEVVHYVTMSDLETFFYCQQHDECLEAFVRNARRVEEATNVSQINAKTLKNILEPLRKLRQDCTVPSIFERSDQATIKKSLRPDELFKHLFNTNEIECKTELRSIASSLNGLAALNIIKDDYAAAAEHYKSVLRWAKEYTGNICVDSLLQIHALHNLILMKQEMAVPDDLCTEYETDLEKLEWKYIQTNADVVHGIQLNQIKYENEVDELESQFRTKNSEYTWWVDSLDDDQDDRHVDQLMRKIVFDIKDQYKLKNNEFTTPRGLTMLMVNWLDTIAEERKNVQKYFGKLQKFTENIKPISKLSEDVRAHVEQLIHSAFICHLDFENSANPQTPNKRKPKVECLLCKVKVVLETYECVIFDKKIVQHKDAVQGTWKPAYQEQVLKLLYANAKQRQSDASIISDGNIHIKLLDALKNEFKEYSQLWVEINYTVSTYDEMNMCKSRLRCVDAEDMERNKQKKTKLDVFTYEVDDTVGDLVQQLRESELKFVRKLGTLKYLKHLEKNKELENCPICDQQPEHKYAVMECGHHMCMICCLRLTKQQPNQTSVKCFICRHVQRIKNLFYVNLRKEASRTDSSSKIEQIVQTIVSLCKEDAAVKIIIFSHWSNILKTIERVLIENEIKFRAKLAKFHVTINEFKDPELNITCLLLPLRYGSKGLNLIEATHVFIVEPILNPSEELQAIGRVHRIGQTKPTFVHRFIVKNTIEETIHKTIASDESGKWKSKQFTVENLHDLFILDVQNDTVENH